jgi:predicted GNAT family acetyltransferase
MSDSLDKLREKANRPPDDGRLQALRDALLNRGYSATPRKDERAEIDAKDLTQYRKDNLTTAERVLATVYNPGRAAYESSLELIATPLEAAGQLTTIDSLRSAAGGIRGLAAINEDKMLAPDGSRLVEPGFGTKVAGAFGSALGAMTGATAMRSLLGMTGSLGKFAGMGKLAAGAELALGTSMKGHAARLGAINVAQSMFRDAEASGASKGQQYAAFFLGLPLGALEGFGIAATGPTAKLGDIMAKIDKRSGGALGKAILAMPIIIKEGATEAAQEGFQTFSEKMIAQQILQYATPEEWDEIWSAVGENALLGGIVGTGLTQLGLTMENRGIKKAKAALIAGAEKDLGRMVLDSAAEVSLGMDPNKDSTGAPRTQASPEEAVARFAESAGIEGGLDFEVVDPEKALDPEAEIPTGEVDLYGRLNNIVGQGGQLPPIVTVDDANAPPGAYVDGVVIINKTFQNEMLAGIALHEILHSKARAGSEEFGRLVAEAKEAFPALTLRMAAMYEDAFIKANGQKPFAALPDGPERTALLIEEGFAHAAQHMSLLVDEFISNPESIKPGDVAELKTVLQRIAEWLRNALAKINIGAGGKRSQALAKLDSLLKDQAKRTTQAGAKPEEVVAMAQALARVLREAKIETLPAAPKKGSPDWWRSALPSTPLLPAGPKVERIAERASEREPVIPLGSESRSSRLGRTKAAQAVNAQGEPIPLPSESLDTKGRRYRDEVAKMEQEVAAEGDPIKRRKPAPEVEPVKKKPTPPRPVTEAEAKVGPPLKAEARRQRHEARLAKQREERGQTKKPDRTRRDAGPTAAEAAIENFERGIDRWATAYNPETGEGRAYAIISGGVESVGKPLTLESSGDSKGQPHAGFAAYFYLDPRYAQQMVRTEKKQGRDGVRVAVDLKVQPHRVLVFRGGWDEQSETVRAGLKSLGLKKNEALYDTGWNYLQDLKERFAFPSYRESLYARAEAMTDEDLRDEVGLDAESMSRAELVEEFVDGAYEYFTRNPEDFDAVHMGGVTRALARAGVQAAYYHEGDFGLFGDMFSRGKGLDSDVVLAVYDPDAFSEADRERFWPDTVELDPDIRWAVGLPSDDDAITSRVEDASGTFGAGATTVTYTDKDSGGRMSVVARSGGEASTLNLYVPEDARGRGVGRRLQARAVADFPKMQGQVSSPVAARTAYRLGRRPVGKPDASLSDVLELLEADGSVNLVTGPMQTVLDERGIDRFAAALSRSDAKAILLDIETGRGRIDALVERKPTIRQESIESIRMRHGDRPTFYQYVAPKSGDEVKSAAGVSSASTTLDGAMLVADGTPALIFTPGDAFARSPRLRMYSEPVERVVADVSSLSVSAAAKLGSKAIQTDRAGMISVATLVDTAFSEQEVRVDLTGASAVADIPLDALHQAALSILRGNRWISLRGFIDEMRDTYRAHFGLDGGSLTPKAGAESEEADALMRSVLPFVRTPNPSPDIRFATSPTIEVDGQERHRMNSDGKPIATTDEALRNFWRWFGYSVVVDDQGRPLVVYHGTKQILSVFSAGDAHPSGLLFFSRDPAFASQWATRPGEDRQRTTGESGYEETGRLRREAEKAAGIDWSRARTDTEYADWALGEVSRIRREYDPATVDLSVLPVYLSVQRPFNPPQDFSLLEPFLRTLPQMVGAVDAGMHKQGNWLIYENESVVEELKRMGYDGMYLSESIGDPKHDTIAVFSPTQIKSATGNRGTFSPMDPDIRRATAPTDPVPWTISARGEGDFYVQRVGPNAGTPHDTRQGPSDFAVTVDPSVLDPRFFKYLIQYLQPEISRRAHGSVQKTIRKGDIDELVGEYLRQRAADTRFATAPTIEVDGQERHRLNSDGKPIAGTDEALRNFWRWFGESKVVDEQGRPIASVHYTGNSFTAFLHEAQREAQWAGRGFTTAYGRTRVFPGRGFFFFTPHPSYVGGQVPPVPGQVDRAMSAYLSIQNPLDLRKGLTGAQASLVIDLVKAKVESEPTPGMWGFRINGATVGGLRRARRDGVSGEQLFNFLSEYMWGFRPQQWNDVLKALGADGLIMEANSAGTSTLEPERGPGDGETYLVAVALAPTQIKSATGNRGTFSPTDPDIRRATAPEEEDIPLVNLGKGALLKGVRARQKWLTSRGLLPQSAFDAMLSRDFKVGELNQQLQFDARDFRKALKEVGGMTRGLEKDLDAALRDERLVDRLPEPLREPVLKMRRAVDALSLALLESGAVEGPVEATIRANMGFYLTRSFQAFDDPDWAKKVPEEVRNRAKAFLRAEFAKIGEPNTDVDAWIKNYLFEAAKSKSPIAWLANGKLGSKDLSILKRRKRIAPEIRALLGEYTDPLVNYARSVSKMTFLIANHQFLSEARAAGLDEGYFSEEVRGDTIAKIAADESSVLAPLNGLYTTPDVLEAFTDATSPQVAGQLLQLYMKANSAVKMGKTVGSAQTHVRNVVGNVGFAVAQGHWNLACTPEALGGFLAGLGISSRADFRKVILEARSYGVTHESAHAGELYDILTEALGGDLNDIATSHIKKSLARRTVDVLTALYMAEDDFWKLLAWGIERQRYAKAYPDWTDAQVKERAAKIVRNTFPTYSLVPRGVKAIRYIPLIGAFTSFPAEVVRVGWNTAHLIKSELADPKTRSIGAQRLAGSLAASLSTTLAALATAFYFGYDDDDREAMREFVPEYSKSHDLVMLGPDKDNKPRYIDISYTDPWSYLKNPINALLRGDSVSEGVFDALKEVAAPFLGEEILAGALMNVRSNQTEAGGSKKVYNDAAPLWTQGKQIAEYLWNKALEPGTVTSVKRIKKGLEGYVSPSGKEYDTEDEVLALVLGQRRSTIDAQQGLIFKARDFSTDTSNANKILSSVASRRGVVDDDEIRDAVVGMEQQRRKIFEDLQKAIKAARQLKVPDPVIADQLEASGVSNYLVRSAIRGVYEPYRVTPSFLQGYESGQSSERIGEIRRRRSLVEDILSELDQ